MKTRTEIIREGELLGPIDWAFDFISHAPNYCTDDAGKQRIISRHVAVLREVEQRFRAGETIEARCGDYWGLVLAVGMYDGWPWWKPYPHVLRRGPLGGEWRPWYDMDEVRACRPSQEGEPKCECKSSAEHWEGCKAKR